MRTMALAVLGFVVTTGCGRSEVTSERRSGTPDLVPVPALDEAPTSPTRPYVLTLITVPQPSGSIALGINERGDVIGLWQLGVETAGPPEAFVWRNGNTVHLPGLGCHYDDAVPRAINDEGIVVGDSALTPDGPFHAVMWKHATATDLGTLGGTLSSATYVNDHGLIAGRSTVADGSSHVVVWRRGAIIDLGRGTLGGLNNHNVVVGSNDDGVFLWHNGYFTKIGSGWTPIAINERDTVLGGFFDAGGHATRAVLWRRGDLIDLGTLGGDVSEPVALNDLDHVIGFSNTADGQRDGFVWEGHHMIDLGNVEVHAINDRDQILINDFGTPYQRVFIWQHGAQIELPTPNDTFNAGRALNNRGVAVGVANTTNPNTGNPAVWSPRACPGWSAGEDVLRDERDSGAERGGD